MKTCRRRDSFALFLTGLWIGFSGAAFFLCGCESPAARDAALSGSQEFAIQKICISTMTDFNAVQSDSQKSEIKTYVELLNIHNSPTQKSCIFRFELYEYRPLTSNPRGKRLVLWPDIDLTDSDKNHQHWRDYFQAYEFHLPLEFLPQANQIYLLEATCLAGQKRFCGLLKIRYQP